MTFASPSHRPPPERGLLVAARELAASCTEYLRARVVLFGMEAREAGGHVGLLAALGVAGLFAALLAYLLLVFAAVFALAALIGGDYAWLWATLGAAVVHAGAAAGLFLAAGRRLKRPFFRESLDQFRKDETWLRRTNSN